MKPAPETPSEPDASEPDASEANEPDTGTDTDTDKSSDAPLTVIPPNSSDDEKSEAGSVEKIDGTDTTDDDGLTVVPSVSTEAVAQDDVLAQTGAAQVLVMLGLVVALGVLGTAILVARKRTA